MESMETNMYVIDFPKIHKKTKKRELSMEIQHWGNMEDAVI